MKLKLKLKNGKRKVTIELEVKVGTISGLMNQREQILLYNHEVVKPYIGAGYYVTGMEDMDGEEDIKYPSKEDFGGHGI